MSWQWLGEYTRTLTIPSKGSSLNLSHINSSPYFTSPRPSILVRVLWISKVLQPSKQCPDPLRKLPESILPQNIFILKIMFERSRQIFNKKSINLDKQSTPLDLNFVNLLLKTLYAFLFNENIIKEMCKLQKILLILVWLVYQLRFFIWLSVSF